MSDQASELPEDAGIPADKVKAFVDSVVAAASDDDVASIVATCAGTPGSGLQRLEIAVNSGVALGAALAFEELFTSYDDSMSGMCRAIERIDELMNASDDPDLVRKLAVIRNAMAEVIYKHAPTDTPEDRMREVQQYYGLTVAALSEPVGEFLEMRPPHIGALAMRITSYHPYLFLAWIVFRNDPTLSCKCPGHIGCAWAELPDAEKNVQFQRVKDTYGDASDLMEEFVRWYIDGGRQAYAAAREGRTDMVLPPQISEAEAKLVAAAALAKAMAGSKP